MCLVVLPKDFLLDAVTEIAECLTEGLLLGNYRFELYKTPNEGNEPGQGGAVLAPVMAAWPSAPCAKGMERGRVVAEATNAARDMANQPGNGWTPADFAEYAKKLAKKASLKCKVLDKGPCRSWHGRHPRGQSGLGFAAQLVTLEYRTEKKHPTLLLVGKGLTFDSGGICTKPPAGMEDMKYDMCGGAAVLTAMQAIAELGIAGSMWLP
jgi:leucyl aminopeptidase